jgi:hypothetical protein
MAGCGEKNTPVCRRRRHRHVRTAASGMPALSSVAVARRGRTQRKNGGSVQGSGTPSLQNMASSGAEEQISSRFEEARRDVPSRSAASRMRCTMAGRKRRRRIADHLPWETAARAHNAGERPSATALAIGPKNARTSLPHSVRCSSLSLHFVVPVVLLPSCDESVRCLQCADQLFMRVERALRSILLEYVGVLVEYGVFIA